MNGEKIGFGLIGFGLFGAHHARAIQQTSDARLAAIAVKSEASRTRAREAHPETDVLADYRQLLERADIAAVSIVAPNTMHFEIALAALESGKHVLLEKPMALTVPHCDQLIQAAEERALTLAVGHELRLSSLWGGAKQLIDEGEIGHVQHVLIELSRFPYREGAEGWRYDIDRVGSWILEEPIHFFDLARWYLSDAGNPVSVYARGSARRDEHPELMDNLVAIVNFADGGCAVINQTLAAFGHHQTAKITGSKGTIWAHWSAADARSDSPSFGLRYGLGEDVRTREFDKPTGELLELADEIAAFTECLKTGASPPCTGADGRWSTLLCLAAERSVAQDEVVKIES